MKPEVAERGKANIAGLWDQPQTGKPIVKMSERQTERFIALATDPDAVNALLRFWERLADEEKMRG